MGEKDCVNKTCGFGLTKFTQRPKLDTYNRTNQRMVESSKTDGARVRRFGRTHSLLSALGRAAARWRLARSRRGAFRPPRCSLPSRKYAARVYKFCCTE